MSPFIVFLVLSAAMAHAVWNAFLKSASDRTPMTSVMMLTELLAALILIPFVEFPTAKVWFALGVSTALHLGYLFFLLWSYRLGDLSQVYPLARGAAPLLATALSVALLDESISATAALGIVVTSASVILLSVGGKFERRAAAVALGTSCWIACYTLVDAKGARMAESAMQYAVWIFALEGAIFPTAAFWIRGRRLAAEMRPHFKAGIAAGILTMFAYSLILYALTKAPVGPVAAMRETAIVFGALIGMIFLGEPRRPIRLMAACGIAVGIALLVAG